MKKILFLAGVFAFFTVFASSLSAKEKAEAPDTYEYDLTLTEISGVRAPYISKNYVVFTAPVTANSIGIAFDFEEFRQIHYYQLRKNYSYEGDVTSSYYFYILEIPKKIPRIAYRVIIDGLWTNDPQNPHSIYNEK